MAANVLVVEDDRLNRNLICKVLRNEGHQVVEACDGAEALELLYAQRFDLVITDFMMPRLNGLKFVEQLHPLQPRLPIIFITGYLSAISGKAILNDVAEVIPKPFELDVLRSTVQRLLESTSH
jgi:two-component system, cell cycle sensor histidine kinase and response regulator CckA